MSAAPETRRESVWWRLVRFGFRLLYNELAWTYDWVSWAASLGRWRDWQRAASAHLAVPACALVLELAHGTGNLLLDMQAARLKPVGYDLSPNMGRIARSKHLRRGITPRLVRGAAQRLPFPAEQFDGLVSTFPTEFIVEPDTLAEAYRVLKPGGRLVIVPNARLEPASLLARFVEWLYRLTGQRDPWPEADEAATGRGVGWPAAIEHGLARAGFAGRSHFEPVRGSLVWVVIAEKQAAC